MGRSLGIPAREPSGKYTHAASNTQFSIEWNDSRMLQRIERNGVVGEHAPAYAIGSGTHAIAYLIQVENHLFQSPLCYYPGRGWGMAPGYENNPAPDFYRPVTLECLSCHAGRVRPVPGTLNTYQNPPFEAEAITCERCHGPAEAHLRAPLPGSIINPAKLPPRARDSICEQCHLSGESRIPNPGKQLSDFQPGQDLEDVYTVYVLAGSRDPSRPSTLKVVSHAQQLALSTCARESHGQLWCGTCHDPHEQPADAKTYFRARCLSCHGAALVKTHPQPNNDCTGCHMPRRPVSDGGHTVFTDHHIARRPPSEAVAAGTDSPQSLVAWHDPPSAFVQRNLGLATVETGERFKSVTMVFEGYRLLLASWCNFPNDPAVLSAVGQVALGAGKGVDSAAVLEHVIQSEPNVASNSLHAALACKAAHDDKKAIAYLEKALHLDPLLEQPYRELAGIYLQAHDAVRVREIYYRYLEAFPQSIEAQIAVAKSGGTGR
jgi:hypothetical protein